jgi:hypothetical protein
MVSVLATGPGRRILRAIKIRSTTPLGGEENRRPHVVKILRHVKDLLTMTEILCLKKSTDISRQISPCFADKYL